MHRLLVIGVAALAALTLCGPGPPGRGPPTVRYCARSGWRPTRTPADSTGESTSPEPTGRRSEPRRPGPSRLPAQCRTHGRGVTIQTDDGYAVTLVHLGTIGVEKGAVVAEGDSIGTMGSSGTPEHPVPSVHLGIRPSSDAEGYVDPLGLLPPRAAPVRRRSRRRLRRRRLRPLPSRLLRRLRPPRLRRRRPPPSQPAAPSRLRRRPRLFRRSLRARSPGCGVELGSGDGVAGAGETCARGIIGTCPLGAAGPASGARRVTTPHRRRKRRRSNGIAAGGSARPERRSARRARHRSERRPARGSRGQPRPRASPRCMPPRSAGASTRAG